MSNENERLGDALVALAHRQQRNAALLAALTPALLDILAPEHDRTSCSDADPSNARGVDGTGGRTSPRCVRCFFLECIRSKYIPDEAKISISVFRADD